jgi:Phage protein Gp138 N-terminal domain
MTTTAPIPSNFTPTNPSLKDLLDLFRQNLLIEFNSHHIGTIQSFNSSNQTAQVSINYQKTFYKLNPTTGQYDPTLVSYPILADAPVIFLGGATTSLTFPIAKGDECLVLFNDRDIDNWFAGTSTAGVATPRLHSFSDAIILVGLRSLPNVLNNYDNVRALLRAGSTNNAITALGVNPNNSKILLTNKYPGNAVTLNTLLQDLINEVKNLVSATAAITVSPGSFQVGGNPVTGTSGTPTNAGTINGIATQLTNTATQIGALLE